MIFSRPKGCFSFNCYISYGDNRWGGVVNTYIFLSILITMGISFKVKVLNSGCFQNQWWTYEKYSRILTSWILKAAYNVSGIINKVVIMISATLLWYWCFPTMFTLLHSTFRFCKITGNKISTGSRNKDIFCKLLKLHFSELQYNYILNIATNET